MPGSPRASQGVLLDGPGHPLLPTSTAGAAGAAGTAGIDSRRVSSLQEELGSGEGVSALLLRSSTAGEGGGPGVVQTSEEAPRAGASTRSGMDGESVAAAASQLLSPPSSPRRRQTTFGATLDFVETLCQASSSLTAFQRECRHLRACCGCVCCSAAVQLYCPGNRCGCFAAATSHTYASRQPCSRRPHASVCWPAAEDRQWALRRALQQINAEIEKASRNGEHLPGTSTLHPHRCAGPQLACWHGIRCL